MPRPYDHYAHGQFEPLCQGETSGIVQCKHCRRWTGPVGILHRKKTHLHECPDYRAWRAAGNGQEILPDNPYKHRRAAGLENAQYNTLNPLRRARVSTGSAQVLRAIRSDGLDVSQFYDEFWDDDENAKCMRSVCKYCGSLRAKNVIRQREHLQQCRAFLNSPDSQQAAEHGLSAKGGGNSSPRQPKTAQSTIPNSEFARPPSGVSPNKNGLRPFIIKPPTPARQSTQGKPSLVAFLLNKAQRSWGEAIQQPFLAKAGEGTLPVDAVEQFLTQENHISRAFPAFIGQLIGKIRLPAVEHPEKDTEWRAFDLLVSTLNNAKRELEFLKSTTEKCGLRNNIEAPKPATQGLIDLMQRAAAPSSSLLEGMIVLYAIEFLHNESWHVAAQHQRSTAPTSTAYSLPTFYQPSPGSFASGSQPQSTNHGPSPHGIAISESLIPNWTSDGFGKFVEACKAIVDELANSQDSGNGVKELQNAEEVFSQVIWLWKQIWPDVDDVQSERNTEMEIMGTTNGDDNSNPINIEDDDDATKVEEDEDRPDTAPS